MPECLDCGNRTSFVHDVEGEEVRVYDEDGTFDHVSYDYTETVSVMCNECRSRRIQA